MRHLTVCLLVIVWQGLVGAGRADDPTVKFHFINVGQGASTLVETKCGVVLIDAGAQDEEFADRLVEYLNGVFERRADLQKTIELVGITHTHIDHNVALRKVVENFTVKRYLDNGHTEGSGKRNARWIRDEITNGRALELKEVTNEEVLAVPDRSGLTDAFIDPLQCDACDPKLRVLSGARTEDELGRTGFKNENNHSVVWRIDFGKIALLITGDLEDKGITQLVEAYKDTKTLDVDLYEVGHHGSKNGTTQELLDAMTPTRAIMEVGAWTFGRDGGSFTTFAYGHPNLGIMKLLARGVSKSRSPKTIHAGEGARRFTTYTVRKAIYGTGFDGNIVMTGKLDGTLTARLNQ